MSLPMGTSGLLANRRKELPDCAQASGFAAEHLVPDKDEDKTIGTQRVNVGCSLSNMVFSLILESQVLPHCNA